MIRLYQQTDKHNYNKDRSYLFIIAYNHEVPLDNIDEIGIGTSNYSGHWYVYKSESSFIMEVT